MRVATLQALYQISLTQSLLLGEGVLRCIITVEILTLLFSVLMHAWWEKKILLKMFHFEKLLYFSWQKYVILSYFLLFSPF